MDEDRDERELRSVFRTLRSEEARLAPAFEPLTRSVSRRAHRASDSIPPWLRLAGLAGVATALVLMLCVFRPVPRHSAVDLEAWSAFSRWTASTDSLLELPGTRLGGVRIATPSDAWMNGAPGSDNPWPTRKETL